LTWTKLFDKSQLVRRNITKETTIITIYKKKRKEKENYLKKNLVKISDKELL